jgi:hypothetical protein
MAETDNSYEPGATPGISNSPSADVTAPKPVPARTTLANSSGPSSAMITPPDGGALSRRRNYS